MVQRMFNLLPHPTPFFWLYPDILRHSEYLSQSPLVGGSRSSPCTFVMSVTCDVLFLILHCGINFKTFPYPVYQNQQILLLPASHH